MTETALVRPFDLAPVKKLVLDAVASPLTRAMYAKALNDFFVWWEGAKNAHRSKTVKVLSGAYTNGSSDVSIKARFQKAGSL